MSEIKIERTHQLGSAEAKKRIAGIEPRLKDRYGVAVVWQGLSAALNGAGVTGDVAVSETRISITLKLGFLLRPLSNKIRASIERQVDEQLV